MQIHKTLRLLAVALLVAIAAGALATSLTHSGDPIMAAEASTVAIPRLSAGTGAASAPADSASPPRDQLSMVLVGGVLIGLGSALRKAA